MNAKPKTELNRCVFVQKRYSVNGDLKDYTYGNACKMFPSDLSDAVAQIELVSTPSHPKYSSATRKTQCQPCENKALQLQ